MSLPVFPTDAVALMAALNSNVWDPFSNPYGLAVGGHRQNFPPGLAAGVEVAHWAKDLAAVIQAYAADVEANAEAAAAGSGTEATAANIRAGLTAQYLSIRRFYEACTPVALTDAPNIEWDMSAGVIFTLTLGAAGRMLRDPTNQVGGKSGLLIVTQDGTGGRSITTWGNNFVWIGGAPAWPLPAGAKSVVSWVVESPGTILMMFGGSSI